MSKKKKKITLGLILRRFLLFILVLVLLVIVGANIYFKAPVLSYYKASKGAFEIPDIHKNFVPQGLAYDEAGKRYYVCGYMSDGTASPIYVIDVKSGELITKIKMMNQDGSDFTGHAGGLALLNGKLYVAGSVDANLLVYDADDVANAPMDSYLIYNNVVELASANDNMRVSHVTSVDGMLAVGEFYRLPTYDTHPSHAVETADGVQHALLVLVELDEKDNPTPKAAYSITDNIQGAYFDGGKLYLTASWGTGKSTLYTYNDGAITSDGTMNVLEREVPLYKLDSTVLSSTRIMPPMAEEIAVVDGQMITMCESACNKYIFGKLTGAHKVYATDLDSFK